MTQSVDRKLQDVIASVQLHDVRLKELSANTRMLDIRDIDKPDVSIAHGARVVERLDDGFIVAAKLTARVDASDDASKPALLIAVTLAITYLLPEAPAFSDEVLEEFARGNAIFNAWPYWREYVQTMSAKMNLPPIVLPVFRIPRKAQDVPPSVRELPSAPSISPAKKGARGKRKR